MFHQNICVTLKDKGLGYEGISSIKTQQLMTDSVISTLKPVRQ